MLYFFNSLSAMNAYMRLSLFSIFHVLHTITQICKKGVLIVVEQLKVISEVIFCVESEFELRIGLSRQDFEIFEVMYTKNGFFGYF